ncbi:rhodanese-like domain-containing protein [Aquimarina sp. M1]
MKKTILVLTCIISPLFVMSQNSLDELLDNYNNENIPYISAKELNAIQNEAVLLDAREILEYQTSHIDRAIFVGYNHFNTDMMSSMKIPKESKIVVYCSLGIRSEDVAEKLKEAGYYNIYNLYGGIFEWKNEGYKVVDSKGRETDNIHTFSRQWGKWLHKGKKVHKK